jgi:hypothetical protein
MRGKIVKTADGVPKLIAGRGFTKQQHLPSRQRVLFIDRTETRVAAGRIRIPNALSLSHWIEGEHHVSKPRQPLAAFLITCIGLAVRRMSHLKKNTRKRRLADGRHIQVGADEKLRAALVDDLLYAISFALESAYGARVQWSFFELGANQLPQRLARPKLPPMDSGRIRQ